MRARAAALLLLVALGIVSMAALVPGGAPAAAQDAPAAAIRLAAQPAWTPLGGDLPLDLEIVGAPSLEVRATVHRVVTSRNTFDRTLIGDALGSRLGSVTAPVGLLPEAAPGARRLTLNLPSGGGSRGPLGIPVSRPGVYPLEIELRDPEAGTTLDSFVTHVVALDPTDPAPVASPLAVAWVVRLQTVPSPRPDGTPDPRVLADMRADGRIGRLTAALASSPAVATVVPSPELLEAWAAAARTDSELAASLARARTALAESQVVAEPYVPLDLPSLLAAGYATETAAARVRGIDTMSAVLDARVDACTAVVDPVDAATLARLREACVDRVLVPADALVPVAMKLTPARPFRLGAGAGSTLIGAAPEGVLSAMLTIDASPALAAQHALAGLALVALEAPNDDPRGIVLDTPANWDPAPELVAALAGGLEGHPLLRAVTLDEYFATVEPEAAEDGQPLTRELLPTTPVPPPVARAVYDDARARQRILESLLPADDPGVLAGQKALLTSLSSAWGENAAGRAAARAQLDVIGLALDSFLKQIEVPTESTVNLTARTGPIPVTLRNRSDRDVNVRVRLESPKLEFPDGGEQVVFLPKQKDTTVTFRVSARSSGTFPVTVSVVSADGLVEIGATRMTVRSTALSGVGIVLAGGAGLFLAAWWVRHFRRNRRNRRGRGEHPAPVRPALAP